jgi:FAD/FMN-containing dehydrogenase
MVGRCHIAGWRHVTGVWEGWRLEREAARGSATDSASRAVAARHWKKAAAAVLLYGAVTVTRFVDTYAGTPEHPKDCDPLDGHEVVVGEADVAALPAPKALPVAVIQRGGTVNDASCLNRTPVAGVVRPNSVGELREVLAFAASRDLKVTPSGARHSMGGQAFTRHGLAIDMRGITHMSVNEERQTLTAGAGATWAQVLRFLHPRGLSVPSMQGVDMLTVGGSVSVNGHGTDHRSGSIASTVRSLDVMLADGRLVHVDRTHNGELFRAVVGGYGLFGVIVSAELDLVPNEMYAFDQRVIAADQFPEIYERELATDDNVHLAYAHLSTAPGTFMDEAILYTYSTKGVRDEDAPALSGIGWVRSSRFMLNLSKTGRVGQWLKWAGQKHVLPHFRPCREPRNDALAESEACLISRNQALYTSLTALRNKIPNDTDILQEYFLPRDQAVAFIATARDVLRDEGLVLVNASIRVVHADDIMLSYAPTDRFAVVLYVNQKTTSEGDERMAAATTHLIDAALARGGTFYLPYQLRYSHKQLREAYPDVDAYFAQKRRYDPDERFSNHLYERYGATASPPAT